MKKFYAFALAALLTSAVWTVQAQEERSTGLPANYPKDGKLPGWYKGAPEQPLVSYHALSYNTSPQEPVNGEVFVDAATGKKLSKGRNASGKVSAVYVIDECCYIDTGTGKRLLKIPVSQLGGGAASENRIAGVDIFSSMSRNIISSDPCNYKDRLAEHQVILTSATTDLGGYGSSESGTTEIWIDCETGIVLASKDNSGYGGATNEIYAIKIGPQPADVFKFPEGYEVVDLMGTGGLMGVLTGKSQEQNTQDLNETIGTFQNAIDKFKDGMQKYVK